MPKAKGSGSNQHKDRKVTDPATLNELGVSMRDKGQGFAGADIRSLGSL